VTARATRDPLAEMFREVVLVLGGVFAHRGTDDGTVCQIARGLHRVYRRAQSRTEGSGRAQVLPALSPHPAIVGLLHLTRNEPRPAARARRRAPAARPDARRDQPRASSRETQAEARHV
jgi:hypothetical protein